MVVSINLFDTNSRVDDLYEELAVRNARTSKVADDLIKVDDMIFNLTQNGSMSKDQKAELEGYITVAKAPQLAVGMKATKCSLQR